MLDSCSDQPGVVYIQSSELSCSHHKHIVNIILLGLGFSANIFFKYKKYICAVYLPEKYVKKYTS